MEALLYQAAEVNGWQIKELSIVNDHMLIQVKPDKALSKVVQHLKGGMIKVL